MHLGVPAEGLAHLADDPRPAGHVFHASGDHEVGIAHVECPGGMDGGRHAGGTEAVDGLARYCMGKPGKEQSHPGDVAVVLSRLIRAAHEDITDGRGVEVRVALQQGRKVWAARSSVRMGDRVPPSCHRRLTPSMRNAFMRLRGMVGFQRGCARNRGWD